MPMEKKYGTTKSKSIVSDVTHQIRECIDHELQEMEKLTPSPYTNGWPEDKWQEEMEKHPFFMTKPPDLIAELHPLVEGLQQLKYCEEENTADGNTLIILKLILSKICKPMLQFRHLGVLILELAETYKKDGIFTFKLEKYRDSIVSFTAGIKLNCSAEIKAQLYNNRAACHLFLSNYRSALLDSQEAVKLNPQYLKAKCRIAQCLYYLEKYQKCMDMCDEISIDNADNEKIIDLRKLAANKKKIHDRNVRKLHKKEHEEEKLLDAIRMRKISILIRGEKLTSVAQLNPLPIPPSAEPLPVPRVYLKENRLIWPAVLIFPQHYVFECIQSFNEDVNFLEILEEVLEGIHDDWDVGKSYQINTVNIYFKARDLLPVKISPNLSLLQAQQHAKYFQDSGVPIFFILLKNSEAEKDFMKGNEK